MKDLFTKLTIVGLISGALVASELKDFMDTNPKSSLQSAMKEKAAHINNAIQEEEAQNNPFVPTHCLFDQSSGDDDAVPHTPSPEELAAKDKAYLESDKVELKYTVNLMKWLKKEAKNVKAKLKTQKGHDTLKAMAEAFLVKTDDLKAFVVQCDKKMPKRYPAHKVSVILHGRLEAAFSAASNVLFQHITAKILGVFPISCDS